MIKDLGQRLPATHSLGHVRLRVETQTDALVKVVDRVAGVEADHVCAKRGGSMHLVYLFIMALDCSEGDHVERITPGMEAAETPKSRLGWPKGPRCHAVVDWASRARTFPKSPSG